MLFEEVLRNLHVDASTIAGLAVGVDGAAVPDRLQGVDPGLDDRAARLAVDRRDKPDATAIVLERRIVQTRLLQLPGISPVAFDVGFGLGAGVVAGVLAHDAIAIGSVSSFSPESLACR